MYWQNNRSKAKIYLIILLFSNAFLNYLISQLAPNKKNIFNSNYSPIAKTIGLQTTKTLFLNLDLRMFVPLNSINT